MPPTPPYTARDHRYAVQAYAEAMIAEAGAGGLARVIDITKPPYGAIADNPTINNRAVIQAALDSGAGAPIFIYVPTGTFYVWPEDAGDVYPGKDCLEIRYDNIRILGAGRKLSTISCLLAGGLDPNTNWEIVHIGPTPYVWRGNGLVLTGATRQNIHVSHLRITGNSPRNLATYPVWGAGVHVGESFPANVATGEGWDLTNKGIYVGNGNTRRNIVIEECEIDSFRGEVAYFGGGGAARPSTDLVIRRCVIHDSIASLLSCSGGLTYEDNEIYYGLNAVEDTPLSDTQVIRGNYIHDCVYGITLPSNAASPANGQGRVIAERNRLVRMWGWGSYIQGAVKGITLRENEFVDCPSGFGAMLSGGAGVGNVGPQDITIERNLVRLEQYAGNLASFQINSDTNFPGHLRLIGNRTERSAWAKQQGYIVAAPAFATYDPATVFDVHDNDWSDGDPSYGPGVDVPGNAYWVYGTTPDNVTTLDFSRAQRLVIQPAGVKSFSTFANAPTDRILTLRVNGNVTITNSATVKLTGGVSFAPGGQGGIITFMRPGGSSAIYELSRFTL
jgi:hypothetical protein